MRQLHLTSRKGLLHHLGRHVDERCISRAETCETWCFLSPTLAPKPLTLSIEASTQPRHKLTQTNEIDIVFGGTRHDRWAAVLKQQPPLCPLGAAQTRRNHSGGRAVGAADAGSSSQPGLWTGSAFPRTNNRPDHPGKTRVGTDAADPDPGTNACTDPAAAHSCAYACTSTDAAGSNPGARACTDPAAAHSCAYACTSTDAAGSNPGARACTDPAAPGPDSYTPTGADPAPRLRPRLHRPRRHRPPLPHPHRRRPRPRQRPRLPRHRRLRPPHPASARANPADATASARARADTAASSSHTHASARANPADATASARARADTAASSSHTRAAARSRSSWTRTCAAAYGKRVAPEAQYGDERKACRAAPRSSHRLHARHVDSPERQSSCKRSDKSALTR